MAVRKTQSSEQKTDGLGHVRMTSTKFMDRLPHPLPSCLHFHATTLTMLLNCICFFGQPLPPSMCRHHMYMPPIYGVYAAHACSVLIPQSRTLVLLRVVVVVSGAFQGFRKWIFASLSPIYGLFSRAASVTLRFVALVTGYYLMGGMNIKVESSILVECKDAISFAYINIVDSSGNPDQSQEGTL